MASLSHVAINIYGYIVSQAIPTAAIWIALVAVWHFTRNARARLGEIVGARLGSLVATVAWRYKTASANARAAIWVLVLLATLAGLAIGTAHVASMARPANSSAGCVVTEVQSDEPANNAAGYVTLYRPVCIRPLPASPSWLGSDAVCYVRLVDDTTGTYVRTCETAPNYHAPASVNVNGQWHDGYPRIVSQQFNNGTPDHVDTYIWYPGYGDNGER